MQNTDRDVRLNYRERLSPSLWMLVVIALVGPMVSLVFAPVASGIAIAAGVAVSLALVALSIVSSPTIEVRGTVLRAGRAHIDTRWLGSPEHFAGQEAHDRRSRDIDREGWHLIRGGIDGLMVVPITDPDDPMRTWTISSRTPDRLSAAIRAAQNAA